MIESIQIKTFRGIQTGQIEGFRKFNLLVGPNNSGKSAVLEALYLGSSASRKATLSAGAYEDYNARVTDKDFLGDNPMVRVWARHNYPEQQSSLGDVEQGHLRVSMNNSSLPLSSFNLFPVPGESGTIGLFSFEAGDASQMREPDEQQKLEQRRLAFAQRLFGGDVETFREKRLVYCWSPDLTYNQIGSAAWIIKGQLPPAQHTLLYDVFNTLGHLPADFFRKMLTIIPGWSQKIARGFDRILGLGKPFNVQFLPVVQTQQWMQGYIAPEDQSALTIDSYGDGARSIFKVLTPLLALAELVSKDAPGLFIWEEPELFQNPQTLGQLLTEVAVLLKDQPIQLFIATHSLEVVAHFVRLVREQHIAEDDMAAIRLNLVNGKLSSSAFDHQDIQDWTEMDLDVRVPSGKVDSPLAYQLLETADATDHD